MGIEKKNPYTILSFQTLIIAVIITILSLFIAFQIPARKEMAKFLLIFPHILLIDIVFEWVLSFFTGPVVLLSPVIIFCSSFLPSLLYTRAILGFINLLQKAPFPQPAFTMLAIFCLCLAWGFAVLNYTPYSDTGPLPSCPTNLKQMALVISAYRHQNGGEFPTGATSGEIFKKLEKQGYLKNREILSCPANPIKTVDFSRQNGVSYYIDPSIPEKRYDKSPIMADRSPWELNHNEKGVNVLFKDGTVEFVRPNDRAPKDKISNPYIEEDTDIYAETGNPEKHAWIRWSKKPEQE